MYLKLKIQNMNLKIQNMKLKIQNMKGSAEKTKIVETTRIKMCCETLRQSLIQKNNIKKEKGGKNQIILKIRKKMEINWSNRKN